MYCNNVTMVTDDVITLMMSLLTSYQCKLVWLIILQILLLKMCLQLCSWLPVVMVQLLFIAIYGIYL